MTVNNEVNSVEDITSDANNETNLDEDGALDCKAKENEVTTDTESNGVNALQLQASSVEENRIEVEKGDIKGDDIDKNNVTTSIDKEDVTTNIGITTNDDLENELSSQKVEKQPKPAIVPSEKVDAMTDDQKETSPTATTDAIDVDTSGTTLVSPMEEGKEKATSDDVVVATENQDDNDIDKDTGDTFDESLEDESTNEADPSDDIQEEDGLSNDVTMMVPSTTSSKAVNGFSTGVKEGDLMNKRDNVNIEKIDIPTSSAGMFTSQIENETTNQSVQQPEAKAIETYTDEVTLTETSLEESDDGSTNKLFRPVVITGPSGVGKGTLIDMISKRFTGRFGFSLSHTSRKIRDGEEDGVHYHFVEAQEMKKGIDEGNFIEYAEVHGNYYGTSFQSVNSIQSEGKICILDIDIQGVKNVKNSDLDPHYIFIAPPSMADLEGRLRGRETETEEQITKRLGNAVNEIKYGEEEGAFDKVLVNDDLKMTFDDLVQQLKEWYPHLEDEIEEDGVLTSEDYLSRYCYDYFKDECIIL